MLKLKILCTSFLLTFSLAAEAKKQKLPFVGKRYFNFMGGSGTGQSIRIYKNGHTVIKLHGKTSTEVLFKGKYRKYIPVYNKENYLMIIGKNSIAMLDRKKNQEFGCSGEETEACVEGLYK